MMTASTAPGTPPPTMVWRDTDRCYRAVVSRDTRFDGQFIVAVRTTGIYCRPSCPAMPPKPGNVEFFPTSAAAQTRGYRACRRCLPDAVPGSPEWALRADLAARAMRLITDGTVEREGVSGLAHRLGYSPRQLGRVLTGELGAGPLALARAHRAHAAQLLIQTSDLPFAEIAFATGFTSVRQFNDTIRDVFAATPTQLRTAASGRGRASATAPTGDAGPGVRLFLRLPFRAPFDGTGLFDFLTARAIAGVETADSGTYRRTMRLPHGPGVVRLTPTETRVECHLRLTDPRDLAHAVARVRRLLDLDADPVAVSEVLRADPVLAPLVARVPGIRIPGAVDETELVVRTVLGQQVSVQRARDAAARLVAELGEPLSPAADGEPHLLFPGAAQIAEHAGDVVRGPRRRIRALRDTTAAIAEGTLDLHAGRDPVKLRAELLAHAGIGPWTADYIRMRALGDPDVLLSGDLALRQGARELDVATTPARLAARAEAWRPWRSYAGMYLWRARTTPTVRKGSS